MTEWLEQLQRIPPKLLRIFALTGSNNRYLRLKTREQIAHDGGLAPSTVAKVSRLSSWDSLRLCTIKAFIKGCGVSPFDRVKIRGRVRLYSRHDRTRQFLLNSTVDQRKMVKRTLDSLRSR